MNEKLSVYESNKEHTNPLITLGVSIMGIFAVINILFEASSFAKATQFDRWDVFPCYGALFNIVLLIVVILGGNCTKDKKIFTGLKCIFFLPLLLALIAEAQNHSLSALPQNFADYSSSAPYVLVFTICSLLRPLYLVLGTAFLAKGLFKPHKYKGQGHLNMVLHIILLLVIPVFYKICWRFRTTRVINKISN